MNGSTKNLVMERLTPEHIEDIDCLQQIVKQSLDDPDQLVPLTDQELRDIVHEDTGMTVGVFNTSDELVGMHAALYPGRTEGNLGYALEMSEEEVDQVFHLEISFIHPAYRGKALMVKMCQWLLQHVKLEGRYRYACATISPLNIGSIKNTMLSGNVVVDLQLKYGGLERYILFQDLTHPYRYQEQMTKHISIQEDRFAPVPYLEQGYVGTAIEKKGQDLVMVMQKPQER